MLKIVVTGGPCAGKTTLIAKLKYDLELHDYKVILVPNAQDTLTSMGITDDYTRYYRKLLLKTQLNNEKIAEKAGSQYNNAVAILDGGIPDQMDGKDEFKNLLKKHGMSITDAHLRYSVILHMITAAVNALDFYQWKEATEKHQMNPLNPHTPENAIYLDNLTYHKWQNSPQFKSIDNSTDFPLKLERAMEHVFHILDEPIPLYEKQKYLIKRPITDAVTKTIADKIGYVSRRQIIDTWLKNKDKQIRYRLEAHVSDTNETTYYKIKNINGIEYPEIISEQRYVQERKDGKAADPSIHEIKRVQFYFKHNDQGFILTVYPFTNTYAILEADVELSYDAYMPDEIKTVKSITDDKNYENYEIAKNFEIPS